MSPLFPSRDHTELERRLRAGATAFGPRPPAGLHGRIVAAVRATPQRPEVFADARNRRAGSWIAAAAAALVLCSAWWLTHRSGQRSERSAVSVVALSRGFLDAGARVLDLPGQAEGNLRLEAEKLLADTTRVAEGVVRGLPAPLRVRLIQM